MFIYHYCATKNLGMGREAVVDGIAQVESRVTTMDEYRKFKELIAGIDDGHDIGGAGGLTVRSLTLMHETPNLDWTPDLIREARSVWMGVQLEAYLAFTNGAESEYERLSEVALGMEEQIYRDCCIAGISNFNTRRILANAKVSGGL